MTILGMEIVSNTQFIDPNIIKIVNSPEGEVLYCSRSPIPHCKKFSKKIGAKRIYAIFAFRYYFLKKYNKLHPDIKTIAYAVKDIMGSNYILSTINLTF